MRKTENVILEIGLDTAGKDKKPYIFLDEIQNVRVVPIWKWMLAQDKGALR